MVKQNTSALQATVVNVSRVHFGYMLAYAFGLIIFDSWNLITTEGIQQRWTAIGAVFILNVVVWYLARSKVSSLAYYKLLVMVLVAADIVFAAINVYMERGMASRTVALFAVPIVMAASLASRRAVFAAAALSTAAYTLAITRYFTEYYGEGYKVELYGVAFLYSAVFFVLASLLWIAVRPKD